MSSHAPLGVRFWLWHLLVQECFGAPVIARRRWCGHRPGVCLVVLSPGRECLHVIGRVAGSGYFKVRAKKNSPRWGGSIRGWAMRLLETGDPSDTIIVVVVVVVECCCFFKEYYC